MQDYSYEVGPNGQQSLQLLDNTLNDFTQFFLEKNGLTTGMDVLDIGCGLGNMTQYLAKKVGDSGRVLAIDNNIAQLNAAERRCPAELRQRIKWQLGDINELATLNQSFDLIYCRYLLGHLTNPKKALREIRKLLRENSIYIGAEGLANYGFSIPQHPAWMFPSDPATVDEKLERNLNIGKIMPNLLHEVDLECLKAEIFQPILTSQENRELLLVGLAESKSYEIEKGYLTEELYNVKYDLLKSCIYERSITIGFFGTCFFSARLA